jgi:hypothetical protein
MRYAPGDERNVTGPVEANATAAVPVSNRFDRLRDQTKQGPVCRNASARQRYNYPWYHTWALECARHENCQQYHEGS